MYLDQLFLFLFSLSIPVHFPSSPPLLLLHSQKMASKSKPDDSKKNYLDLSSTPLSQEDIRLLGLLGVNDFKTFEDGTVAAVVPQTIKVGFANATKAEDVRIRLSNMTYVWSMNGVMVASRTVYMTQQKTISKLTLLKAAIESLSST